VKVKPMVHAGGRGETVDGGGTETLPADPMVTVAIPCLNEEDYIEGCINTVQAQDYPPDRMEILVADGRSTDRTREILERLAAADTRIEVIDNPDRLQAPGLNRIIAQSRGKVIVRMDVHCEYAPSYVSAAIRVLRRTGADNAGGAQRPRARTGFQKAVAAALASPLAVGGAAYRSADRAGFVDTVFLGAFRREVFDVVGLYDPKAETNEDAELNQRLLASGGSIYLDPSIEVYYYPRPCLADLARQYYRYGRGRARTILKHRKLLNLRPAIPFLAVAGGTLLLLSWPVAPVAPFAFGLYALITAAEALRVGRRAGWRATPLVWAILPTLHVSHGVGFGAGLARYSLRPDWPTPEAPNPS
jgi:glycosyltransferase involved in cell wall biosynthesis